MRLLFRYDDFSETSDVTLDLSVLETLISHGFKPLVGVVPAIADVNWEPGDAIPLRRLSRDRARLLERFLPDHLEIALHGFTHQTVTRVSGLSEFGDAVDLGRQVERIREGKHLLEELFEVEVSWFIPPWNTYTTTTLQALKECGLRGISANASFGPVMEDLVFAPVSCSLKETLASVACARSDPSADVLVVLHDYDFHEGPGRAGVSVSDFACMLTRLTELGAKQGAFGELLETESEAWGPARARANQELRKHTRGSLRFVLPSGWGGVYWDEAKALKKLGRVAFGSRILKRLLGRQ